MSGAGRLARLPRVDHVLGAAPLVASPVARRIKRALVQAEVARLRERSLAGAAVASPDAAVLAASVRAQLEALLTPRPRRVINATGVLLHTNLGRAPLSAAAIAAMSAAAGCCDLELELPSGRRSSRQRHLVALLELLLGAPALVVNNGAAALLLACTALGGPGGVVISRGQMVEIGDGFRIAEMAAAGGTRVWEVGSTNRTHLADYEAALLGQAPGMTAPASALLWVHLSNFRQDGFVHQVALASLAGLAKARGAPLIADLGSGSLGGALGAEEPTIHDYVAAGADLITCSGDKLLGGPQAGLIVGAAALVERCRRHPLARALRPDKTTIAALHATAVAHALEGPPELPLHHLAAASVAGLRARAGALAAALGWPESCVRATTATIGGGSLPGETLEGVGLVAPVGASPDRLAARLRCGEPPVIGRVYEGALILDLRSVPAAEDAALLAALRAALGDDGAERQR